MDLKNFTEGYIVKYATQVEMIISICRENGCSIILSCGNEVKEILKTIGFKQFGEKCYIPNFHKDFKKSELEYDYPQLIFDYYNGKVSASVFFHKIGSQRNKENRHSITYLHELQEVYRNLGYPIPILPENLSLF